MIRHRIQCRATPICTTAAYGSEEIQKQDLTIRSATVSENGRRVRLVIDGLRELFVHALEADGVRSEAGRNPHCCIPMPITR